MSSNLPDLVRETVPKEDGDVLSPVSVVVVVGDSDDEVVGTDQQFDPHYEPIISLPEVVIPTNEENEIELVKVRARLYRFISHQWKERGTGDIKLLHHPVNNSVRVVMRRDKTFKICANHFVKPDIDLSPHLNSDRAFTWSSFADFADECPRAELFAIKFGNPENAAIWKTKFEEAKEIVRTKCSLYNGEAENISEDEDSGASSSDESNNSVIRSDKILETKEEEVASQLEKLDIEPKE